MKYLLLLILFLYTSTSIKAQVDINRIDSLIDDCKIKVKEIDNQVLYKTLLDYDGYRIGNESSINEWLAVLYFDKEGILKKSKILYYFPNDTGYYQYYFDKGVAIYSTYSAYSAMNNGYSVSRCLDTEGNLLSIDFIRRDNDRQGQLIERIQRTGGYDLSIPLINGELYDNVTNTKDLVAKFNLLYGIDSLYMPKKTLPVAFVSPRAQDKTSIITNSVLIYKSASMANNLPLIELNVGDEVTIIHANKDWCKIKYIMQNKQKIGYIQSKFLAPVEIPLDE